MRIEWLPHLNALLNTLSALLLACGYAAIRGGKVRRHAGFMLTAFITSVLFLTSYVIYHIEAGHKVYPGVGWSSRVYLTILFSHIILAFATVPLALTTLAFALRKRFDRHRRIARWTFPIWMYVSVTGVVVYLMLYQF
jgi:uncharacterized membrane protein YozB (DUF420 family)